MEEGTTRMSYLLDETTTSQATTRYQAVSVTSSTTTPNSTNDKNSSSTVLVNYHRGLIVLAILIFIANVLAIQIYKRHIKVRRNLSNVLLVSLSISDLIAGVLVIPCIIYCEREFVLEIAVVRNSCRVIYLLQNFCGFSTIFHIITVTIEKYIAVMHPFQRINITTSSTYRMILITLWTWALIFALIPSIWLFEHPRPNSWHEKLDYYAIFQIVIFFGMSLVILSYCYCRMFIQIHGKLADLTQATRTQTHVRNERKTIIVFLMFFAIFAIGWLPWFVLSLDKSNFDISQEVFDFLITLRYAGAVLNPFVYAFLKNDYKEAIQLDLRRCFAFLCPTHVRKFQSRRPRSASENNNSDHTVQHSYLDTTTSMTGVRLRSFQPLPTQRSCSFNSASQSKHSDEVEV